MAKSGSGRSAPPNAGDRPAPSATDGPADPTALDHRYVVAFLDWLGCAAAGACEPAARGARADAHGISERVLALGVAGHVLDFDDTYVPGLAHLSAPTAPVALALGAELDRTLEEALAAYAAGFEAMAALARASHPALYDRGWHPTAVCGAVGAAVTAAALLGHSGDEVADTAVRLALAQASGLRRSFGSDAKAIQVGAAAAAGVLAAQLAARGATATRDLSRGPGGFEEAFGAAWAEPDGRLAVTQNWIKAYPCCLKTHSPIEAAEMARGRLGEDRSLTVTVHPRARQAAPYDDVETGLEAKFSIPYTVAYTLLHGPPREPSCFADVDPRVRAFAAAKVEVRRDDSLPETGARLELEDHEPVTVQWATGSPANPMTDEQLAAKLALLAGSRLDGLLDQTTVSVSEVLAATGLD